METIGKIGEDFNAAYNAGDAAALADLFTDDAVLIPPNGAPHTGKERIQSRYQWRFDQFTVKHSINTEETKVAGDWAFSRGTYKLLLTPKEEGEPSEVTGMYILICQRQRDDSWKIARLIWNGNHPPPEP